MITCKEYVTIKKEELKNKIKTNNICPRLVVFQIGDNPASNSYIKGKHKDCEEVGIEFHLVKLPETITQEQLQFEIELINTLATVHGIILQLPVPDHINVKEIQEFINPDKDVDGFNKYSIFTPCTPLGVINYLKYNNYDFEGKNACVIGRSDIVGKPLSSMLTDLNCTVTLCHSKTKHLEMITDNQDIIFTCIDRVEYFDDKYFLGSQDVIDIGLGRNENGKLVGNLTENAVKKLKIHAHKGNNIIISGTGGVGLLTRLELLNNTYEAALLSEMQYIG